VSRAFPFEEPPALANKRRDNTWPRFDDLEAVRALARAYPAPEGEEEDEAAQTFPEAVVAARLARWFEAAADALLNKSLPERERQRLGLAVEAVVGGPEETLDDKRRAIIRIVEKSAAYKSPPPDPSVDDPTDLEPEEERRTPQQQMASLRLAFFAARHPIDGREIDREALLEAVSVWQRQATDSAQSSRGDRSHGGRRTGAGRRVGDGKYKLIARGIRRTSFRCEGASDSEGGDHTRLVELARPPRAR
jgi:hypothetical protein